MCHPASQVALSRTSSVSCPIGAAANCQETGPPARTAVARIDPVIGGSNRKAQFMMECQSYLLHVGRAVPETLKMVIPSRPESHAEHVLRVCVRRALLGDPEPGEP